MNFIATGSQAVVACCRKVLPVRQAWLRVFRSAATHKMTHVHLPLCQTNNTSVRLPIIKITIGKLFEYPNKDIIFIQKRMAWINPSNGGGNAGKQLLKFFVKCSLGAGGAQPPVAARPDRYACRTCVGVPRKT